MIEYLIWHLLTSNSAIFIQFDYFYLHQGEHAHVRWLVYVQPDNTQVNLTVSIDMRQNTKQLQDSVWHLCLSSLSKSLTLCF